MLLLLALTAYLLLVAATHGALLGWTLQVAAWAWRCDPPVMTGLAAAVSLGLLAALIYPRYRTALTLTRTVIHHAPRATPPDGGSPLAAYLASLAADHWREHRGAHDNEPLADVLDLGAAREHRRAA